MMLLLLHGNRTIIPLSSLDAYYGKFKKNLPKIDLKTKYLQLTVR